MNRIIKFKQTEEQKVFFGSDFHLGHNPVNWNVPIWKMRGFNSVDEMNNFIIDKTNEIVRPTDLLFFCGDFVLNTSESQFNEFLSRIKCQSVYMIFGNHNSCVYPIYQREVSAAIKRLNQGYTATEAGASGYIPDMDNVEIYPFRYKNIVYLGNYAEIVVDGQMIVLSHYCPQTFNKSKDGSWAVFGHSHSNLKSALPDETNCGKIIDCGFDVFRRPISFDELKPIMDKKKILVVDHHRIK